MTSDPPVIRIAAAIVPDGAGGILLVRKRGTAAFMQPGGKPERGESPRDTVVREIAEELGCLATVDERELGTFRAEAANEPGHLVEAVLYRATLDGPIRLGAEIEEAVWFDPSAPRDLVLAPLTRHHVLPFIDSATRQR